MVGSLLRARPWRTPRLAYPPGFRGKLNIDGCTGYNVVEASGTRVLRYFLGGDHVAKSKCRSNATFIRPIKSRLSATSARASLLLAIDPAYFEIGIPFVMNSKHTM